MPPDEIPSLKQLQQADLNGLVVFLRLADSLNFTTTARQLGISPPAVSQAIRALEARVGATLVSRTTRQVGLTEAGATLLAGLRPALSGVEAAIGALEAYSDGLSGRLRLNAPAAVAPMLWRELLAPFSADHPDLEIEVHASDSLDTVFADGFDAGVRLGGDLEPDITAFPLSEPFLMGVFASPTLLDQVGRPSTLAELDPARCIRFRNSLGRVRNWMFQVDGAAQDFTPAGRIIVDDAASNLAAAAAGAGFAYGAFPVAGDLIAQDRLEQVLVPISPWCPGLFLYYPSARQASPRLRALIEFVRRTGRYKAALMPPSTKTAEPVK